MSWKPGIGLVAYATWQEWDESIFAYRDCFKGFAQGDTLPAYRPPFVIRVRVRRLEGWRNTD